MIPTKEQIMKYKYRGDLKIGDVVYIVQKDMGDAEKGVVVAVYERWNSSEATLEVANRRTPYFNSARHVMKRKSGFWGARWDRGFLMRAQDLSWKDRIESLI